MHGVECRYEGRQGAWQKTPHDAPVTHDAPSVPGPCEVNLQQKIEFAGRKAATMKKQPDPRRISAVVMFQFPVISNHFRHSDADESINQRFNSAGRVSHADLYHSANQSNSH